MPTFGEKGYHRLPQPHNAMNINTLSCGNLFKKVTTT